MAYVINRQFKNIRCSYRNHESSREFDHRIRPHVLDIRAIFETSNLDQEDSRTIWEHADIFKDFEKWINDTIRDRIIVADNDPRLPEIKKLADLGIFYISIRPMVNLEYLTVDFFNWFRQYLEKHEMSWRINIRTCEITEDDSNTVCYVE